MNLALRDIRHNLGRFLLTCLGLSLLLGVVMSMIGIYRGLVVDALTAVRGPAVDLWVVEAGTRGPFAESSRIPADTREAITRLHGVAAAGALTFQSIEVEHRERRLRLYAVGFEPGRPGAPTALVEGRPIAQARFEMLADVTSGLAVGERVRFGRNDFQVVGLTVGQVSSSGDPMVFLALRDSQRLQFELAPAAARRELARGGGAGSSDIVNAVVARVLPAVPAQAVAAHVTQWKHLAALTQGEQETILTRSVIERARRQIGLFTAILLLVSTVVIALIIYTLTMDKVREIATLKLIGAPDRTIVGLILQQALAMGAIGFGFGAVLISLLKGAFPRRVVVMPEDLLALGLVVFAVCLVASALGVRLALKIEPAAALGG